MGEAVRGCGVLVDQQDVPHQDAPRDRGVPDGRSRRGFSTCSLSAGPAGSSVRDARGAAGASSTPASAACVSPAISCRGSDGRAGNPHRIADDEQSNIVCWAVLDVKAFSEPQRRPAFADRTLSEHRRGAARSRRELLRLAIQQPGGVRQALLPIVQTGYSETPRSGPCSLSDPCRAAATDLSNSREADSLLTERVQSRDARSSSGPEQISGAVDASAPTRPARPAACWPPGRRLTPPGRGLAFRRLCTSPSRSAVDECIRSKALVRRRRPWLLLLGGCGSRPNSRCWLLTGPSSTRQLAPDRLDNMD